ncbi:MAG: CopG family transcriptional regulator [Pseudomonadota bacterium]
MEFRNRQNIRKTLVGDLQMSKSRRPEQVQKRVNVDFPVWRIHLLDKEARRLGVPRQSIIKVWVADRLEKVS